MRGKARSVVGVVGDAGITPACAGKSCSGHSWGQADEDHPRVCGEKCPLITSATRRTGSPPRMRGKDSCGTEFQQPSGITPAYAGKRLRPLDIAHCERDHPRVCGEKLKAKAVGAMASGSPPRMRGKGVQQSNSRVGMGITPAYAGKSAASSTQSKAG